LLPNLGRLGRQLQQKLIRWHYTYRISPREKLLTLLLLISFQIYQSLLLFLNEIVLPLIYRIGQALVEVGLILDLF